MSLLPSFFLDSVVAIGTKEEVLGQNGQKELVNTWVASGFLYGHFLEVKDRQKFYKLFLVTNRHVLEGAESIILRFNPTGKASAREYPIDLKKAAIDGTFSLHPSVDLAIVAINSGRLDADGIQYGFFQNDDHVATKSVLEDQEFCEGDEVFVLGFPMSLVGKDRNYVIVRHGIIARMRDYLAGVSDELLIDALVFPGNSGGPVVSKIENNFIVDTQPKGSAYLLGVTAGTIPYKDVAISQQTKRARIVFEDNSGLSSVVPIQFLIDFIDTQLPKLKKEEAQQVASPSPAMEAEETASSDPGA